MTRTEWLLSVLAILAAAACRAAEIHSNGSGGGRWSDPATWHGSRLPAADDTVVIATGDTVAVDAAAADTGAMIRGLSIDPDSALVLRAIEARSLLLTIAGPVECYGTIRLEGVHAARGTVEVRLTAEDPQDRVVRLRQNGSFLAYGREGLDGGNRNVILRSGMPEPPSREMATVRVTTDSMLDVHHCRVVDVAFSASDLDNTGARPNQRLTIVGNQFRGAARLSLARCDTPTVRNNRFDADGQQVASAVEVDACQLADIQGNEFRGRYGTAIRIQRDTDSTLAGNRIEDAETGVFWSGSNAMLRTQSLSGCTIGMRLEGVTGVVEDTVIEGCTTGVSIAGSTVQLTDVRVGDVPADGRALSCNGSAVTLLNSNLVAEQIDVGATMPPGDRPPVQALMYVVVKVAGTVPAGTTVDVRTNEASGRPKPGAADMNVRNAPARLMANGLTPLPRTMRPLVVRSWSIQRDGTIAAAPFYDLVITAPAAGKPPQVLETQLIEPHDTWYRPEPNAAIATLEVTL